MVYWVFGYPQKGLNLAAEALALAEHLAFPLNSELALLFFTQCFTSNEVNRN
jgi:hypothetical protein